MATSEADQKLIDDQLANLGADAQVNVLEKTTAQLQEEMNALVAPLLRVGFPEGVFNVVSAMGEGFSYAAFAKLVRAVVQYDERSLLEDVVAEGTAMKFWRLHNFCTRDAFVRFSRWLTSKDGESAVFNLNRDKKLEKKATHGRTPEQVAFVQVFDQQRQQYATEVKRKRAEHELSIEELNRQLRAAKKAMDRDLEKLKEKFVPASLYAEPADEVVGREAVILYKKDCLMKSQRPKTLDEGLTDYAKQHFGQLAREKLMVDFASKPEHKEVLLEFLAERLCSFRADNQDSQARVIGHFMVTIGGDEDAAHALQRAQDDFEEVARRKAAADKAKDGVPTAGEVRKRGRPRKQTPARSEGDAGSQSQSRDEGHGSGNESEQSVGRRTKQRARKAAGDTRK